MSPLGIVNWFPWCSHCLNILENSNRFSFRAWVRKCHLAFVEKRKRDPMMWKNHTILEWTWHISGPEHGDSFTGVFISNHLLFAGAVSLVSARDRKCMWWYSNKNVLIRTGCRLYVGDHCPRLGRRPQRDIKNMWLKTDIRIGRGKGRFLYSREKVKELDEIQPLALDTEVAASGKWSLRCLLDNSMWFSLSVKHGFVY